MALKIGEMMDKNKALGMVRKITMKSPSSQLQLLLLERKVDYFQKQEITDRQEDKHMDFESIQLVNLRHQRNKVYKQSQQYKMKHQPSVATAKYITNLPWEKRHRICQQIVHYLTHKERLGLSLNTMMKDRVFSVQPYQKTHSEAFIRACKTGEYSKVERLLRLDKYLVYDYDICFMTGLHWACRRKHPEIVALLLAHKADVDQKDIIGRSCVYYCLGERHRGQESSLRQVLFHKASPWSDPSIDYKLLQLTKGQQRLLSTARKINILLTMFPCWGRRTIWQRQKQEILLLHIG